MIIYIIKDIRELKKVTLKELSNKTHISISYLSEIENNKKSASLEIIYKISMALNEEIGNVFFADSEIESVRKILHRYIREYGLMDDKTQKISGMMDGLITKEMNKKVS